MNEDVANLKSTNENEIEILKHNLIKLKEEKQVSESEMNLRLKQMHERYLSMQTMDSSAASVKIENLFAKLTSSEIQLTDCKSKCSLLSQQFVSVKKELESNQEESDQLKSENIELLNLLDESKNVIANQKHHYHSSECTNKILEEKLFELQKIIDNMKGKEKDMSEQISGQQSLLKVKENEIKVLQDSFEKSTGLVVGSFKELKQELNNELREKTEALHNVSSTNEELSSESKSLLQEKSDLGIRTQTLEEKLSGETKKREDAEKTVVELKAKVREEMKYEVQLQQFVNQVWEALDVQPGSDENLDTEDGLLKKKKKSVNLEKMGDGLLKKTTPERERESTLKVCGTCG